MARSRTATKSDAAFRTISEVSDHLQVPQHVLRFWETKFDQVQPMKRGGGRRYYRPEDIELLRQIRDCLYAEGYTIKGVQKLLREGQLRTSKVRGNGQGRRKDAARGNGKGSRQAAANDSRPADAAVATSVTESSGQPARESGDAALDAADRQTLAEILRELEDARAELTRRTPPRRDAA